MGDFVGDFPCEAGLFPFLRGPPAASAPPHSTPSTTRPARPCLYVHTPGLPGALGRRSAGTGWWTPACVTGGSRGVTEGYVVMRTQSGNQTGTCASCELVPGSRTRAGVPVRRHTPGWPREIHRRRSVELYMTFDIRCQ